MEHSETKRKEHKEGPRTSVERNSGSIMYRQEKLHKCTHSFFYTNIIKTH